VGFTGGATWPVSLLMILIASMTVLAVLVARETAPKLVRLRPVFAMVGDAPVSGGPAARLAALGE